MLVSYSFKELTPKFFIKEALKVLTLIEAPADIIGKAVCIITDTDNPRTATISLDDDGKFTLREYTPDVNGIRNTPRLTLEFSNNGPIHASMTLIQVAEGEKTSDWVSNF